MRVAVVGTSGAGKTTVASRLASRLACDLLELDSIYHQANWQPLGDEEMHARVADFVVTDAWVVDGNYQRFTAPVLARATDLVWVDPPRAVVMVQVIQRSLMRVIGRSSLWNGNRERMSDWLSPEHPIRWAWSTFDQRRRTYEDLFASPEVAHARKHRLRSRRDIDRLLAACDPIRIVTKARP